MEGKNKYITVCVEESHPSNVPSSYSTIKTNQKVGWIPRHYLVYPFNFFYIKGKFKRITTMAGTIIALTIELVTVLSTSHEETEAQAGGVTCLIAE